MIAINEAVDRGQASVTMGALNNPNAMLRNTYENLAEDYQASLSQAKARKQDQASGRVRGLPNTSLTSLSSNVIIYMYMLFEFSKMQSDFSVFLNFALMWGMFGESISL